MRLNILYPKIIRSQMTPLRVVCLLLALSPAISFAYDIELLTPQSDAEEYEFVIYPDGVEKRFTNTTPMIDSNDLPNGSYEYKRRIKINNQWSSWSEVKIMNVSAYSEKYKSLRINPIKAPGVMVLAEKRQKIPEMIKEQPVAALPAPLPLTLSKIAPFISLSSRSVKTENESESANSQDSAQRLGMNFQNKSYESQIFYEAGSTYSRLDLWAMKALTSYLQIGARITKVSADFKTSTGTVEISNTFAFVQAGTKHETKNGYGIRLNGAATLQGSFMGSLQASKAWKINHALRLIPIIGYEYLNLKTNTTNINSSSWMTGLFIELGF